MRKATRAICFDVGARAVKAARVRESGPTLVAAAPLPSGSVRDGRIVDRAPVVGAIDSLRRELGARGTSRAAILAPACAVGVHALDLDGIGAEQISEVVRFELSHRIAGDLAAMIHDFDVRGGKVVAISADRSAMLERSRLLEDADLVPVLIDVDVLAVSNLFAWNEDGIVILTGHEWLSILVLRSGIPHMLHTLREGTGAELQSMLEPGLDERAAELAGGAEPARADEARELGRAIDRLADGIAETVRNAVSRGKIEPKRVVMAGGLSLLPGIREGVADRIDHEVERIDLSLPATQKGAAPSMLAPVMGLARRFQEGEA
ncbi:MAG: hypothetical protein CME06_01405 [Gemmatimonadetes bacterium]|nr:hypothetical protein [Gemmatimonadota bacterium]